MAPRKASKTLNLEEKVDLINHHEKTGKSIRDLAVVFDVSRSQVANVLKRKREYVADYESNAPRDKKRCLCKTSNEEINELCWKFFLDRTSRNAAVSGPLLQELTG